MSTAIPAGTPAPASEAAPAKEIFRPLLWLLGIVVLGLGLRVMHMHFRGAAFEVDEFTTLAAVAERPGLEVGTTPTEQDPLVPVPSLAEVSKRSVIPFGIRDPLPLYHDFLWAVVHVLPVAAWSVRLPSLLAGVACIAVVFFLVRRPFGTEMALVAALFVALDPIQTNASWLAQPFALADLFTVLSFAALLALLRVTRPATAALCALGYAACVALIGYLNPLMLLVVTAHAVMVLYAVRGDASGAARKAAGYWAGGLALGLLLLAPEYGYYFHVSSWAVAHRDYLTTNNEIPTPGLRMFTPFVTLFLHNAVFLGGLVLVLAAGAVVRMQLQGGDESAPEGEGVSPAGDTPGAGPAGGSTTAVTAAPPAATAVAPPPSAAAAAAGVAAAPEPAAPLPENDEALRMARLWVFLPQVALLLASLLVSSVFATRNMAYTTLGAAVLLAYYATRDGSREVRLGVAGVVALAMLAVGFWNAVNSGDNLLSSAKAIQVMGVPNQPPPFDGGLAGTAMSGDSSHAGIWKPGDVVLSRPGLIEADFVASDVPPENRAQVERVLVAPLTLLYPDSSHKPVIALTYSQYRNEKIRTPMGDQVKLDAFYDDAFADRLKQYDRYWTTGIAPNAPPNSWQYLSGLVPWMADHLDRGDLVVARDRKDRAERYVVVKPGLGPDEPIKGLTEDRQKGDFDRELHLVRRPDPPK